MSPTGGLNELHFCTFLSSHEKKFFFNYNFIYLFFWLRWVFVSVRGLSLVAASGGHSSSRCAGLSLSWPLLLRSTGSRRAGSAIVAHGPGCSAACGILPDQGLHPCPLHWQADSQPLRHQGSPKNVFCLFACLDLIIVWESFVSRGTTDSSLLCKSGLLNWGPCQVLAPVRSSNPVEMWSDIFQKIKSQIKTLPNYRECEGTGMNNWSLTLHALRIHDYINIDGKHM